MIVLQRGSALVFEPLGTSGGSSNSEDSVSCTMVKKKVFPDGWKNCLGWIEDQVI